MTRDELKNLACLGFSADLVMQSFCHTAPYPKPMDVETHHKLPDIMQNRLGKGANVYLASAELAAVAATMGRIPSRGEYMKYADDLDAMAGDVYRYLDFNQMENYLSSADSAFPVKVA